MQLTALGWDFGLRFWAHRSQDPWRAQHEKMRRAAWERHREWDKAFEIGFMPELRNARTPFSADLHLWELPGDDKRFRRVI